LQIIYDNQPNPTLTMKPPNASDKLRDAETTSLVNVERVLQRGRRLSHAIKVLRLESTLNDFVRRHAGFIHDRRGGSRAACRIRPELWAALAISFW